jgi:exonuclease SbcC
MEKRSSLLRNASNIENDLKSIESTRQNYHSVLARREEIEAALTTLKHISAARGEVNERMADFMKAGQEVSNIKVRRQTFVAESRQRIGEIEARLTTAGKKTALLNDSECPIAETASCAFLRDAQEAKATIAELQVSLAKEKSADRKFYEKLNEELETAQKTFDAMNDPTAEIRTLAQKEKEATPIASLATTLEAAAATIAELDKRETAQIAALTEINTEIAEIANQLPPMDEKVRRAARLREEIRVNEPTAALYAQCTAAEATYTALTERIGEMKKNIEQARKEAQEARSASAEIREGISTPVKPI